MRVEYQQRIFNTLLSGKYACDSSGNIYAFTADGPYCNAWYLKRNRPAHNGYRLTTLVTENSSVLTVNVHNVIYLAFNGTFDPDLQINHIDGDKQNNHITNLEAVTPQENIQHAHKLGLMPSQKGINNPGSKLTESEVLTIRREFIPNINGHKILARKFGVTPSLIFQIIKRKIWTHI